MLEIHDDEAYLHPLDNVESVLAGNNWVYNRTHDDELMVKISGRNCSYNLYFIWQENMGALQYVCEYDMNIDAGNRGIGFETIMEMNAALWMGHFEVDLQSLTPSFRYTLLQGSHAQRIEDLVDISLAQCERYQPVFQVLSQDAPADTRSLSLAMMDIIGES